MIPQDALVYKRLGAVPALQCIRLADLVNEQYESIMSILVYESILAKLGTMKF